LLAGAAQGLGQLMGTPDASRAASAQIDPSLATTLAVTDASGVRWTLSVPAGAAPFVTTVTITPLTDVTLSHGQLHPTSAVRFSPSGLSFNAPVTVTVATPSAHRVPPLILTSASNGTQTYVALPAGPSSPPATTTMASASLVHFSEASADWAPPDLANATANLENAFAAVQTFLRSASAAPPQLPLLPYDACTATANSFTNNLSGSELEQELGSPELTYIAWLTGDLRLFEAAGGDPSTIDESRFVADLGALASRIVGRTVAALNSLGHAVAPGTVEAVVQAGLSALEVAQLAGALVSTARQEELGQGAAAELETASVKAMDNAIDDELHQLTEDHQYSAVATALVLAHEEARLGGHLADTVVAELAHALTFRLTAQADVSENGSVLGPYAYHSVIEVTGTLQMDKGLSLISDEDATGVYKSGHNPFETQYHELLKSWATAAYSKNFDFCKPVINLIITKWGADEERFYNQYGHAVDAFTGPAYNAISQTAVTKFAFPDAATKGFAVDLANGAATSVYTISATGTAQPLGTKYDVQVLIQLDHIPHGH
jgi:hypothetical protein